MMPPGQMGGTMAPPDAPPTEGIPAPPPPGTTGPATVPPRNDGAQMRGRVEVSVALRMLTKALAMMGAESKEGQEIAAALAKLGKTFGETDPTIERAEAKMISESVPANSPPSPGQQESFAAMAQKRLGGMGMGPSAPPG